MCAITFGRAVPMKNVKLPRRQFMHLAAGAAALPAVSRIAWAQAYPTAPVRVIVPFAPGGPSDVIGRLVAQKLSEHLGRQFFVENIGGAGSNVGMGRAARAVADGYTILVVAPNYVINPALYDAFMSTLYGLVVLHLYGFAIYRHAG